MISPQVSIIIPVYNVEAYLNRCINSILNQSYTNYEVILVDDGSTDGSSIICDQYAKANQKVYVIHKDNGGLSNARLAGFEAAKGQFVLFVDSDDYVHEDILHQMVNSMKRCQADLVMCGYYIKKSDKEQAVFLPFGDEVIQGREVILETYIKPLIGNIGSEAHVPGFIWIRLMKRELIKKEYFKSEREYFMEDHVFDLLYADRITKISIVPTQLYYYCVNKHSLTTSYRERKWKMLENLYAFYGSYVSERGISDCQKRLDSFLLHAFCLSVDNAVASGTYAGFRTELKCIASSKLANQLNFLSVFSTIPKTYKLTVCLYYFRLYHVLYYVRKTRMKRW